MPPTLRFPWRSRDRSAAAAADVIVPRNRSSPSSQSRRRQLSMQLTLARSPPLTGNLAPMKLRTSTILRAFDEAQSELIGKAVVLTDGKAGTVENVWLDEFHGLRISIRGHDGIRARLKEWSPRHEQKALTKELSCLELCFPLRRRKPSASTSWAGKNGSFSERIAQHRFEWCGAVCRGMYGL